MKIEMRPIDKVIPYARNPRKNDASVVKVAASIKEFGWRQPLVVDKEGVVIAGHTRLEAARQLGLDEVPVHVADLSPAKAKAYRLADNRLPEDSHWDYDLLALEVEELQGLDIDLGLTGFTDEELNSLLHTEGPPGLDELEQHFGQGESDGLWPEIKVKVPPDTLDYWQDLMSRAPGDTDYDKVASLLEAVDTTVWGCH